MTGFVATISVAQKNQATAHINAIKALITAHEQKNEAAWLEAMDDLGKEELFVKYLKQSQMVVRPPPKTLQEKLASKKWQHCPDCDRLVKRLDKHRASKVCKKTKDSKSLTYNFVEEKTANIKLGIEKLKIVLKKHYWNIHNRGKKIEINGVEVRFTQYLYSRMGLHKDPTFYKCMSRKSKKNDYKKKVEKEKQEKKEKVNAPPSKMNFQQLSIKLNKINLKDLKEMCAKKGKMTIQGRSVKSSKNKKDEIIAEFAKYLIDSDNDYLYN